MDVPKLIGRRNLLTAGSLSLVAPALGAAAQPAVAAGHKEAAIFNLWVISDAHIGTDKAMSEAAQHGMVGFAPPPVRPESMAEALRQSEEGSATGGKPIPWDIALNLGDYAGFWDGSSSRGPFVWFHPHHGGTRPRMNRVERSSGNTPF